MAGIADVAPIERLGPELTLSYLGQVGTRIKAGNFRVDPQAEATRQECAPEDVKETLDQATLNFAADNKTHMLGVQAEDVLNAALTALTAARESGEYAPFLKDCILGLNLGPTIARSHVQQYRALSEASLFRAFEIKDRTLEPGDSKKGDWVANSSMNATAVRWLGLLLFCMTNEGSFLDKVAKKTGTVLSPPPKPEAVVGGGTAPVTRASLLNEAAKEVTPALRAAIARAAPILKKTMAVLDLVYGQSGPGLEAVMRVAESMKDYEL